jgi:hypothetical protein
MKTTAAAVSVALISFLIGNAWVFISADLFVNYFYEARMVALTHVFTLGWVSLMIVGVLRQLGPVAFGLKLHRPDLIGAAVLLWIPAVAAMVLGFATAQYGMAALGTLLLSALIVVIGAVFLAGFGGVRREPPHDHLLAAILYFVSAAFFGAWMGLAKGFDWTLPAGFHRVLFTHIHLAAAGWAGMMILAVMSRLFPQPHLRAPIQSRVRFAAFNVGLVGLSAGLLSGGGWYPIFGAILAVSCIWYALAFIPVLREFGQPSDRSTAFLVASWTCLIIVALLGIRFTFVSSTTVFSTQLQFVYGFLYMFGWLSLMILGMLYRIIPTHVSKLLNARGVTATGGMRRAFIDPSLQLIVLAALLVGLAVSSAGIAAGSVRVFRIGWASWLAGITGFMAGIVRLGVRLNREIQIR